MVVSQTPIVYFTDLSNIFIIFFLNIIDLTRHILVYSWVIININDKEMNRSISVTMFILMWLNSNKLLMVFYATRYMIRLITELIFGLNGFLVILLIDIAAYC